MAGGTIPHFQNDAGHPAIEIGVKEFMCVGANPPFDHPHVFLDMGADDEKVCAPAVAGRTAMIAARQAWRSVTGSMSGPHSAGCCHPNA